MILRLDPAVPVVWRSPSSVQLGVDPVVGVFDGASRVIERLLAALAIGVPESALPVIAEAAGGGAAFAAALLDAVRPALLPEGAVVPAPQRSAASLRVAVDGRGPASAQLAAVLRDLGLGLAPAPPDDDDELDAAVLVGSYAVSPLRHGVWLRRDIPHLAVVFGERSARIGPFVEPGAGPCLSCVDLASADADPCWPVIAAQLAAKRAPSEAGAFATIVTLRAAQALLDRLLGGSRALAAHSLRLGVDGVEASVRHPRHDRCGCRALPETGTAAVLPLEARRSRSSSDADAAARV